MNKVWWLHSLSQTCREGTTQNLTILNTTHNEPGYEAGSIGNRQVVVAMTVAAAATTVSKDVERQIM